MGHFSPFLKCLLIFYCLLHIISGFCIVLAFSKKWILLLQLTELVQHRLDLNIAYLGFVRTHLFQFGIGPITKILFLKYDLYSLCVPFPGFNSKPETFTKYCNLARFELQNLSSVTAEIIMALLFKVSNYCSLPPSPLQPWRIRILRMCTNSGVPHFVSSAFQELLWGPWFSISNWLEKMVHLRLSSIPMHWMNCWVFSREKPNKCGAQPVLFFPFKKHLLSSF